MTDIPRDDFMATSMPTDPAEKWKAKVREIVSKVGFGHTAYLEGAIFAALAEAYAAGREEERAQRIADDKIILEEMRKLGASHD